MSCKIYDGITIGIPDSILDIIFGIIPVCTLGDIIRSKTNSTISKNPDWNTAGLHIYIVNGKASDMK